MIGRCLGCIFGPCGGCEGECYGCSYNKIGGTWACENQHTIKELLKKELGFKGYVVTDWNAGHSNIVVANAGLDIGLPGTKFSFLTISPPFPSLLKSLVPNRI
jgi:hypothetical protein